MRRRLRRRRDALRLLMALVVASTAVAWVGSTPSAAASPAELISVDPNTGGALASYDYHPSVSGDGNIVVFTGDRVWARNRSSHVTTLVPLPNGVSQVEGGAVSRDGCQVVFFGLPAPGVFVSLWNVYRWNRCNPAVAPAPISATALLPSAFPGLIDESADGRYVAYVDQLYAPSPKIARVDTVAGTESVLPNTFASVDSIDISDDGSFVAIGGYPTATGSSLVLGWSPPCAATCATEVVSIANNGQPVSGSSRSPSVSADGRYVAFVSNTVDIMGFSSPPDYQLYVRDRVAKVTKLVTDTPGQPIAAGYLVGDPDITPDGNQIAFIEMDGVENEVVWVARSTSGYFNTASFDMVSYGPSGNPVTGAGGASDPVLSSNARFVAFDSQANTELSGGTVSDNTTEIWMRDRPIRLDGTPALNFGTVNVGTQSPGQNVVITNNGIAEVAIASVTSPAAPFSIIANTCVGLLPAGASCAVTVVFAPTAAVPSSGSIVVSGEGLSVSTSLTGTGRTPTGPTPGFLTIKPTSANFGTAVVGTSLPAKKFVVTNAGASAVVLTSVGLGGAGFDQFAIDSNGCTGSLAPAASCTIQVSATATRDGAQSATLDVLGAGGVAAHATLRIGGEFTPTLKMVPGVAAPGEVTSAIGAGFPPNITVDLAFEGEAPFVLGVPTDGDGNLHYDLLLLPHGIRIGGRQIVAVDQADFSGVRAPLLIQLATSRPSGFGNPIFTSGVRALITRGG